mgnify:CR=1 FL=1
MFLQQHLSLHSIDLPMRLRLVTYIFKYVQKYETPCLWATHDGIALRHYREAELMYLEKGEGNFIDNWKEESSFLKSIRIHLLQS